MSIPLVLLRRVRSTIIPHARVYNRGSLYNVSRGATLRRAPLFCSVLLRCRGGVAPPPQPVAPPPLCPRPADPPQVVRRSRLQGAGADPPRRVNLVPPVRGVVHPRADDLDARAFVGNEHPAAVPGDDLDDHRARDALVAISEELLLAVIEANTDVEVAVVELGF